jgi:hypothetical protein
MPFAATAVRRAFPQSWQLAYRPRRGRTESDLSGPRVLYEHFIYLAKERKRRRKKERNATKKSKKSAGGWYHVKMKQLASPLGTRGLFRSAPSMEEGQAFRALTDCLYNPNLSLCLYFHSHVTQTRCSFLFVKSLLF